MKTIAALLATICVAASFAEAQGGVHPIKIDPSQCGFYAGLSFTTPNGVLSHCKVVATLIRGQGATRANLANGWTVPADMRGAAANHCQKFRNRFCHAPSRGPLGRFCFGSAGDQMMTTKTALDDLRACLSSIKGPNQNINNWAYSCGDGAPLDYQQFSQ